MSELTDTEKKEKKRIYDIEYRKKNKKSIQSKKIAYNSSPDGRAVQKRRRVKIKESGYALKYNKQPEQRKKERYRRYKRLYGDNWREQTKKCLGCDDSKLFLEFEGYEVFPDKRHYLCKECEAYQQEHLGCSTRNTMTAMVMRPYTTLTRQDIALHPELIEANKFLILLKQLLK